MALPRSLALVLCLAGSGTISAETAAPPRIELLASRDFGYTIGSLVEHRIRLWLPDGAELVPALLPSPGAVNDWLDLRALRWEREGNRAVRIDVTYQVFKGVRDPETAAIPPLTLTYHAAGHNTELRTPEWPFGLIPLIPPATPDERVPLRGDAHERSFPTDPVFYRGLAFVTAAALGGLGLALRFGLMPGLGRRPFADAYRRLKRLGSMAGSATGYDTGLRLVHEALDLTHGQPVFPVMLERFLAAHPPFAPLKAEFEQFFLASQRHFFDPGAGDADIQARWQALERFCRRCAQAERTAS